MKTWQKIDRACFESGLTLAELSEATGIAVPNLSALRNGRKPNVTFNTVVKIAKALGVSLDNFISDDMED